jgi:hypothetical protein
MLQNFVGKTLIIEMGGGWMVEAVLLGLEPSLISGQGSQCLPFMKIRTCRGDIVYLDACNVSGFREPSERDKGPKEPMCMVDYCGMWRKLDDDDPEVYGGDDDSSMVEEVG